MEHHQALAGNNDMYVYIDHTGSSAFRPLHDICHS